MFLGCKNNRTEHLEIGKLMKASTMECTHVDNTHNESCTIGIFSVVLYYGTVPVLILCRVSKISHLTKNPHEYFYEINMNNVMM